MFFLAAHGQGFPYPPGHLHGLTLANNVTDSANDIDIAPGSARADDNSANLDLAAPLTKRLDAAWAAGTGQGALDTGSSKTASRTYHAFLIRNPATGAADVLFSQSFASPAMPSGFTQKRRLGAVMSDAAANNRQFFQQGDSFYWKTPPMDLNTAASGTTAVTLALTVPGGTPLLVRLQSYVLDNGIPVRLFSTDIDDIITSYSAAPLATACAGTNHLIAQSQTWTNNQGQIRYRTPITTTLRLVTLEWLDSRGRLA